MMPAGYSVDLRQKVLEAVDRGERKSQVCRMFNISRNTLDLWLKRRDSPDGIAASQSYQRGHSHKITDWQKFRAFVQQHGDKTQAEMAQLWEGDISARTIARGFKRIGFTRKKKTYGYCQRDEVKRAEFQQYLATCNAEALVYVDEAGMDERDDYGYGWSPKGNRFEALKSGRRQGRINMIAAYRMHQLIAPFTVEGACHRSVFETWLETCLIPALRPGQWVILDNATFHHGGRIQALIEAAQGHLLYLPPYSPDLNRIEKCWAWLKSRIRKQLHNTSDLREAMELVLKQAAS